MIRLTGKVFTDLAIWMIGLGMLIGLIFPFLINLMGIPANYVMHLWFFGVCILAGITVGALNILLARTVVGKRLKILAQRMQMVQKNLDTFSQEIGSDHGSQSSFLISIDSDDEIGETAISFNHLVEALSLSYQTERAGRSFTELLANQLEVNNLTEKGLDLLLKYTNCQAGAILTEIDGELKLAASHGIQSPEKLLDSDHVHRVLRREQEEILYLPNEITIESLLTNFRPQEMLVTPILYKHTVLGLIILANTSSFSQEDQNRLKLFSHVLALALQNALSHEHLQRLAAVDPLTGAYNRRFGLARLHEEFGRSIRTSNPLGMLIFDIDHFKNVNDTYGHLVGDKVLVMMTKLARSVIREGDILIRYGGEEFLAILPAASMNDVIKVAERLLRIIGEHEFENGSQKIRVTISLGCTSFPEIEADNETELIKCVDEALYVSKETGRNRFTVR